MNRAIRSPELIYRMYSIGNSTQKEKGKINQVMHRAGSDLTRALGKVSHDYDMPEKFRVVGKLLNSD